MSDETSQPPPPAPRRWIQVDFSTGAGTDEVEEAQAIAAVSVGDDELVRLATATNLVELAITGTFTDEGLAALGRLERLEHLFVSSPNLHGSGFGHLAGTSPLRVLGIRDTGLTPKGARRSTTAFPNLVALHISGRTVGVDHVVMLRPLPALEVVTVVGGGDFLGGGDCKLDRASAVEFVTGCPALRFYGAWWSHGMSMLAERSVMAMSERRPGATINGTWYDPSLFGGGPSGGDEVEPLPMPADGGPVRDATVLSNDDFAVVVEAAPVALVKCWSSSPDLSRRAITELARDLEVMDQVAQVLAGQALVGTVDLHQENELGPMLGERYQAGIGVLLVFRAGKLVARLSARTASTIVALLEPVFEPRRGPGGWSESEPAPQMPG